MFLVYDVILNYINPYLDAYYLYKVMCCSSFIYRVEHKRYKQRKCIIQSKLYGFIDQYFELPSVVGIPSKLSKLIQDISNDNIINQITNQSKYTHNNIIGLLFKNNIKNLSRIPFFFCNITTFGISQELISYERTFFAINNDICLLIIKGIMNHYIIEILKGTINFMTIYHRKISVFTPTLTSNDWVDEHTNRDFKHKISQHDQFIYRPLPLNDTKNYIKYETDIRIAFYQALTMMPH